MCFCKFSNFLNAQKVTHDQAVECFNRYDRDKNGKMNAQEIRQALKSLFNYDVVSGDMTLVRKKLHIHYIFCLFIFLSLNFITDAFC